MSGDWLVCQRPNPDARLRLLCFHYAGGGASTFAGWAGHLPDEVEVCAVRLPGREARLLQRPYQQIGDLVPDLAEVTVDYCQKPFVLFGHSMGALVAFELARWMRTNGQRAPEHLLVSARRAPHLVLERPLVHTLPDDDLIEWLRQFGGVPDHLLANRAAMRIAMTGLRADIQLNDTYEYHPSTTLDCPVTVFGGLHDSHVERAELEAWAELTSGGFQLHMMPGNHFFINSGRVELLEHITRAVRRYAKQ
ncbi:thioesterase II family protein [Actinophytocola sediminis]